MPKKNSNGQTFRTWESEVNGIMLYMFGVGVDDIPDTPTYDWFMEDISAQDAAQLAIDRVNEDGY